MALITCPECGAQISDKAAACIHCGCPIEKGPEQLYHIELLSSKTKNLSRLYDLLAAFPSTSRQFSGRNLPFRAGYGLKEDNARWYLSELEKIGIRARMESDSGPLTLDEYANKYIEDERDGKIHCPKCKGTSVTTNRRGFSMMTGFIGANKVMNMCSSCGYKWEAGN